MMLIHQVWKRIVILNVHVVVLVNLSQIYVAKKCKHLFLQNKPFVLLHPTCVFSYKPELLHPKHDLEQGKHDLADLKGLLSNKHELLTFV